MITLNKLEQVVMECSFVYPPPPSSPQFRETLRYRYREVGQFVRILFTRDDDANDTIDAILTHRDAITFTEEQTARGVRVRLEYPWEWLDRVHDGPLPIGDDDHQPMTATDVHEQYPHLDGLLREMAAAIQEHYDPNTRRAAISR